LHRVGGTQSLPSHGISTSPPERLTFEEGQRRIKDHVGKAEQFFREKRSIPISEEGFETWTMSVVDTLDRVFGPHSKWHKEERVLFTAPSEFGFNQTKFPDDRSLAF